MLFLGGIQTKALNRLEHSPNSFLVHMQEIQPFTGHDPRPEIVLGFLNAVSERITGLLSNCTQFQLMICFGSFLLESAAVWFYFQIQPLIGKERNTLEQLETAFKARYLRKNYLSQTLQELRYLRQTGSIQSYVERFKELSLVLAGDDLFSSNRFLLHTFLGGLNP